MSIAEVAGLWAVVICASILRAFTGFGFALAAVPFLSFFLAPVQVVVLVASLSLALGIQTFPQYRQNLSLRPEWPLFAAAALGTVIGAWLLQFISEQLFRLLIGVLVIVASVVLARFHPRHRQPRNPVRAGAGLASGLMNGAFMIPGPPIIIYAMATQADPARSRAFMIAVFSFSSLVALASYAAAGLVGSASLWLFLAAYPAMWLGDKLGYRLFLKYGGALYRRVAVIALVGIGISIIARALWG